MWQYSCILAAVEQRQVEEYKSDRCTSFAPSKTVSCSHLIAYSVSVQPLGQLLGEALDGGERLRDDLWHPLRFPIIHQSAAVRQLQPKLADAWEQIVREKGMPEPGDWYWNEIAKVLDLFNHAKAHEMCVLRFLQPPFDQERAKRVIIPIDY